MHSNSQSILLSHSMEILGVGRGGGVEVLRILGYRKSDGCLISVWGFQILPGVLRIELRFELILFKDFSW